MGKNFEFAAAEAESDDEAIIEFTINGESFVAHEPTEGQLALFTAAFSKKSKEPDIMQAVLDIIKHMLEDEGYERIEQMLEDRTSGLTFQSLMSIIEYLVEEFTARPTPPSSASTPQRRSGGTKSTETAPARASTRSRSPRAASAT